jgi:LmbE family N-acetylglucosaminyl deacetylase
MQSLGIKLDKSFLRRVWFFFLRKVRGLHANIIFYWLIYAKSRPLICNQKSAIVFSPHQDDETLGCGGMIAFKRLYGVPVRVVFLTDGQGGVGKSQLESEELIQLRKQEAISALDILGVEPSEIDFLDRADGTLQYLSKEEYQCLVDELAQILISFKPDEVYVTYRKDGHGDHEATYNLVKDAIAQSTNEAEIIEYPIWLFWDIPLFFKFNITNIGSSYRLSIRSVQNKKKQAFTAYHSQSYLDSGFLRHFLGTYEIFFKRNIEQ